jgi:hypothetical protein
MSWLPSWQTVAEGERSEVPQPAQGSNNQENVAGSLTYQPTIPSLGPESTVGGGSDNVDSLGRSGGKSAAPAASFGAWSPKKGLRGLRQVGFPSDIIKGL